VKRRPTPAGHDIDGETSIVFVERRSMGPAEKSTHPLFGLLVCQALGAFNDNAWKQIVVLLAFASTATEASAAQEKAALAQVILLIPLIIFNLPGGVLADRLSKRTVIVAMKGLELVLMVVATLVLLVNPSGGIAALAILTLLGIQAALFSPSKYGILPELLPHEKLSSGNGLIEMWSNLAIIGGTVAGGVIVSLTGGLPWLGGLVLAAIAVAGFAAALAVPHVPVARSAGGLLDTLSIAWTAIRGDRILSLAICGQFFVWSIASLIPAPLLSYASKVLALPEWMTGFPLAAIGIGIGAGSLLAGRLSASKVEYGLVPLGALGLTLSTLAFALFGPELAGTILLMGLVGVSAGLVFVPLYALVQWRAPEDRRGAVIALGNMLVNAGMLVGSVIAMALAWAGFSAQGTCLIASVVLLMGTIWSLWLVPDAFLRFALIMLAHTFYRLRVTARENVPETGPALLTPNHVSFADGLFVIGSIDRPIRFVVYAEYFKRALIGRFLRVMKAIPIASSGGPKMILEAFREAGRALDHGELVCIFPEGQITRTGMTLPFQRGMERIVKGRDVPIIPVHIDRATASIFSPMRSRWVPERLPLPITVSFGRPLPATAAPGEIRQTIADLDQQAWSLRKEDRRPLHREFIRQVRRHPFRMAVVDAITPELSCINSLAGAIALARALRPRWLEQEAVGIMLPSSAAGALANLAATLSGRVAVNLNFTAGRAAISSAARQAGLSTVVTSRAFVEKGRLEVPEGLDVIWMEDLQKGISRGDRAVALALACLAPVRLIEQAAGATRRTSVDDTVAVIFSSGSEGDPKGVVLSHFNIDSQIEAIAQAFRIYPTDRILDILPLFHSYGFLLLWLGVCRGLGLVCHVKPQESGAVGALIEEHRATVLFATPAFLNIYTRRCPPAQFGSLRLVITGAERLPESIASGFEQTFGIRPLEGYGMTECSPVVAVNAPDYRAAGFYQPGSRRGTVGHPLPGVSLRIVKPEPVLENDNLAELDRVPALPVNTEGLILVKGPNVMKGYLNREDLTAKAICDGWYVTGDLGVIDEDAFLTITGRFSRFSKIGGEMVPHGRVEEALNEAIGAGEPVFAVTSVTDGRGGDRLAVLHTAREDQVDEALGKLRTMGLPNLFLPRRDHFVKVESLPLLGTGKLDLRALKRIAGEALAATTTDAEAAVTAEG
jgi:acyl-[acyl-carrier-protein]-phospholipid O-acyltransferase/long-chain-fatty-acid--[acyl-carrier-protein] ligase